MSSAVHGSFCSACISVCMCVFMNVCIHSVCASKKGKKGRGAGPGDSGKRYSLQMRERKGDAHTHTQEEKTERTGKRRIKHAPPPQRGQTIAESEEGGVGKEKPTTYTFTLPHIHIRVLDEDLNTHGTKNGCLARLSSAIAARSKR